LERKEALCHEVPSVLNSSDLARVRAIGSALVAAGEFDLRIALERGLAIIKARPSRLAPFATIPRDVWSGFEPRLREHLDADEDYDELVWDATARTGERLFSLHVAAAKATARSGTLHSLAERRCEKWLCTVLVQQERVPQAALKAEAMRQFSGLSGEGFKRAFKGAVARTGASEWTAPGRPRKSPKSKTTGQKTPA
jgi:hypothetical protein